MKKNNKHYLKKIKMQKNYGKKVTEDYGDLSEDEYDALKKDKLKKIDALKAAGGDDKHVEELLQLVEESDRLREEYASESAGAGDLMKEINELLNGDAANIFDDILVQKVDDRNCYKFLEQQRVLV